MHDHDEQSRVETISIGEFAERTQLTQKALRLYHRIELLVPVQVDPFTGYRRYALEQVRRGQLIGMLREADVSLTDIRLVVDEAGTDPARAVARLEDLSEAASRRQASRGVLIRHIQTTLIRGAESMFEIHTRSVPARRVMTMQRRLHAAETDAFVDEAKRAFAQALGDSEPTGPLTLIFHGIVDPAEHDGPLEVTLGCPDSVIPTELVGIRTEPAHDEAYTTITKAQWSYPAILAAYDAVGCSPEVAARPGSRLSCREVYLAAPDDLSDGELICDVAFPLGGTA
jgi:DNA-binding transcriptional MerR regulator